MEFFTNPWVIGIGTAIIAGVIVALILRFVFGIWKPKPKHNQISPTIEDKNHSTPPPVLSEKTISDITPKKIREYLDSLPPLQKDSAAENYKGIRVSWKVNLAGASTQRDGKLYLVMFPPERLPFTSIACTVDPDQYPILRVIKKDQTFTIEGEIEEARSSSIELKNCRFFF